MITRRRLKETMIETSHLNLKDQVSRLERNLICEAMDYSQGNQTIAAKVLGISRGKLLYKLKEFSNYIAELKNNIEDHMNNI